jgi:hypothetical protein
VRCLSGGVSPCVRVSGHKLCIAMSGGVGVALQVPACVSTSKFQSCAVNCCSGAATACHHESMTVWSHCHSFVLLAICCHVLLLLLLAVCIAQNAACVALFPVPVPLPGFYSTALTQFSSCVPASACLGVDVQRVTASFSSLLLGGVEELRQVGGTLVLHIQEPRVSESSLDADLATLPRPHEQVDALFQHFFAAALGQPANGTIDNSSVGRQTCVYY